MQSTGDLQIVRSRRKTWWNYIPIFCGLLKISDLYLVILTTNWASICDILFEKDFKIFPLCSQPEIFKLQEEEGNPMKLHSEASVWRQWKHWIWMRQDVNKITEHVMKFPFRLQIRKPLCHICWLLPPPPPSPPPQHHRRENRCFSHEKSLVQFFFSILF